jgi:hypothetical protein
MKNILIVIVALFLGVLVLRYRSLHRNDAPGAAAGGAALPQASPNGFTPIVLTGLPNDKVVVIAPAYCSSEEGQRADQLTAQLTSEGIPCIRAPSVNLSFDHVPSSAEMAQCDQIMKGRIPIIYINGRAKNSPELSDIIAEFRSR